MSKIFTQLKRLLGEQLWLIALLAPLVVFAVLGVMTYNKKHSSVFKAEARVLLSEAQLSRADLAMIVAKPLGELMKLKVYFDEESSTDNALVATLSTQGSIARDSSNVILLNQSRRNRMAVLTYVSSCNSKRNQVVTEQA